MFKTCLLSSTARRPHQLRRIYFQQQKRFATMASKYELPEGFLSGPAPNLTKSKIDFAKEGLPDFDGLWAVVLDGVMSKTECEQLVAAAEATTDGVWERAMVNVGGGMQAMYDDVRRCGRIIWDDRTIMEKLWARIESSVPDIHRLEKWASVTGNGPTKRNEVWKVTRLNERARFLKYVGGEYFKGTYGGLASKLARSLTMQRKQHIATAPTKLPIARSGRTLRCTSTSTTLWARTARRILWAALLLSTLGTWKRGLM
jgi:hypothetical protein